jgi:hypothetical protein
MIIKVSPYRILNTDNIKEILFYAGKNSYNVCIGWGPDDQEYQPLFNKKAFYDRKHSEICAELLEETLDNIKAKHEYFDLYEFCKYVEKKYEQNDSPI